MKFFTKRSVLGSLAAMLLAVAPASAVDVFPTGTGNKDFCEAFNLLINNALISSLPPEFQSLVGELNPTVADINGTIVVDDSGSETVISIVGNGLLDANNELRLIERILADPSFDNGVLTHAQVLAAWDANIDQMRTGQLGVANAPVIDAVVKGLIEILVGYITFGDGTFSVDGDVTTATGSFGFVSALYNLLSGALEDELGLVLADNTIDAADFVFLPELVADADADGDGFTNRQEYNGFTPDTCSSKVGAELFPVAALDPLIVPEGGEGEGEGEGSVDVSLAITGATLLEAGDDIELSIVSSGLTNPILYQWRKNGVNIPGRILPTLVINDACDGSVSCGGIDDSGVYDVVVNDGSAKAQFIAPAIEVRVFPLGGVPVAGGLGLAVLVLAGLAGGVAATRKRN